MRNLTLFQPIAGQQPSIRLADDPHLWLPGGTRPTGPTTWKVALHVSGVSRVVQMTIDPIAIVGASEWRSLRWDPVSERGDLLPVEHALPTFEGELGLNLRDGHPTLVLTGRYDVPLGWVGVAIDAILLARAARASGIRFLGEIAARMAGDVEDQPSEVGVGVRR